MIFEVENRLPIAVLSQFGPPSASTAESVVDDCRHSPLKVWRTFPGQQNHAAMGTAISNRRLQSVFGLFANGTEVRERCPIASRFLAQLYTLTETTGVKTSRPDLDPKPVVLLRNPVFLVFGYCKIGSLACPIYLSVRCGAIFVALPTVFWADG